MNQTKKELSYFRLKLEGYLRDHHPELVADNAFIGARADLALSSYCDSVAQGFSHLEAEAMASSLLAIFRISSSVRKPLSTGVRWKW